MADAPLVANDLATDMQLRVARGATNAIPAAKHPVASIGALKSHPVQDLGVASDDTAVVFTPGGVTRLELDENWNANTVGFTLPTTCCSGIAEITQDGVGSHTVTWPTGAIVGGTLVATADLVTIADWYYPGSGSVMYVTYRAMA